MAILPLIGTALASAALSGAAVNVIKNNSIKNLDCGTTGVFSGGQCVSCLGGSDSKYSTGVEANVIGCRCPVGLGWDASSNRCILCPKGTSLGVYGGGGKTNIRGCSCDDTYKYNLGTGKCIECPKDSGDNPTWGMSDGGSVTNTEGCYCIPGQVWNDSTKACDQCITATGVRGIKDGKCIECPEHSSMFSIYGDKTNVYSCNCDNGYIYKDGKCVICPSGYITSYGKCCPTGSSQIGSGPKVIDGCYCLPYHTLTNGNCTFEQGGEYVADIKLVHRTVQKVLLTTSVAIPVSIPTYVTGKSGFNLFLISVGNTKDLIFIKAVTIEYTTTSEPLIIKKFISTKIRDLYGDKDNAFEGSIIGAENLDTSWIVKRIIVDMVNIPTQGSPVSELTFGLMSYSSDLSSPPVFVGEFAVILQPFESNRRVAFNISV